MKGRYVFADYASEHFRALDKQAAGGLFNVTDQGVLTDSPVAFGEGEKLYVASFSEIRSAVYGPTPSNRSGAAVNIRN
ncbi:hypothetical protein [Siphonobacter aquaeclarae]|uniref:hypothetical protein n=1 Tax=Siphonobacter aquaeclarae TaxID=563176 RepID=UPI000B839C30|nr:hypothetical protein [Siphonobacter aquaeclarae]